MLYYLFTYLDKEWDVPGAGVFQFISFRALSAAILALLITMWLGKYVIARLREAQVKDTPRQLGLPGEDLKKQTPTMGGLLIIAGTLIPTLLFAKLHNIYILLLLGIVVLLGTIGFIDDHIKVFKNNKKGLAAKTKLAGQVAAGTILALTMIFSPDIQVRIFHNEQPTDSWVDPQAMEPHLPPVRYTDTKKLLTTIPFVKNNEFDYEWLTAWLGKWQYPAACVLFVLICIFIVAGVSNGVNLTDGLDGLAAGTSAIVAGTLAVFAYVSGNVILADYLNIMYIPDSGEIVIFSLAFAGSCTGFLWYNSYPAEVFMGDTGSLTIGGLIAALAIILRKELLLPLLGGIYLVETVSVIVQVGYFKYTRRRTGTGKRLFLMAPIHHHFQLKGIPEPRIVSRFWIVAGLLAALTLITLKLR